MKWVIYLNKIKVEALIPKAIEEINIMLKDNRFPSNGKIPNEFKGYISNFGASIVQSGLLSTIAFYGKNKEDTSAQQDRRLVNELILNMILPNKNREFNTLFDYVLSNSKIEDSKEKEKKNRLIKEDVINAAIALKLAIRVFEFASESRE